jgi:hypothetical protein
MYGFDYGKNPGRFSDIGADPGVLAPQEKMVWQEISRMYHVRRNLPIVSSSTGSTSRHALSLVGVISDPVDARTSHNQLCLSY